MTDDIKKEKQADAMDRAMAEGYVPHSGMMLIKCPRCGNGTFKSYPQGVDPNAKIWVYEISCTKCRQGLGLPMER